MRTADVLAAEQAYVALGQLAEAWYAEYNACRGDNEQPRIDARLAQRMQALISTRYGHASKKIPTNLEVIDENTLAISPESVRIPYRRNGMLPFDVSETGGL